MNIHLIKSLRFHQWFKGIFIILPLVFGQKLFDIEAFTNTMIMLVIYNTIASGLYLINDVIDIEDDRKHPQKSKRPIAAGLVTIKTALITASLILTIGIPLTFLLLGKNAFYVVTCYLVFNYLYMRYLKHAVIIDVFCLGFFFYLRILAGAIASGVVLSNWILMCTVLLALFLGFNKRRYDLEVSKDSREVFKKYNLKFLDHIISVISASLVMAYSLYVMDSETAARFGTNNLIYSVPFVYYGLFRYIYLMDTKWFGGDSAKIIIGDYKIQITVVLWLCVCIGAIYFKF